MRKNILFSFFIALILFFAVPSAKAVFAASLSFDPATVSTSVGQTFQIKVKVDAGADQISSVDARILYDQNLLSVDSVTEDTFFPTVSKYISNDGKLYVAGMTATDSKTGSGIIATVQFSAKKDGTGSITYDCTSGSTKDSNIVKNDANATDIIQCSLNGKTAVTIGAGSAPTPTSSLNPVTPTRAPTELLQTGTLENVIKFAIPGVILLFVGMIIRIILLK